MRDGSYLEALPTHRERLANGLTVLVRPDHSAPVVAIVTHVRAGYFDEPDPVVGISHVLEHMFFKGTTRRQPGQLAVETRAAGGYLNAGTIYDHTSYYTVLPSRALQRGLDIQADALLDSVIDADELRRELQVIIQEAKRKLDSPTAFAQESLYESMFDVHRMRRWRIGTEAHLSRLDRAQVWGYYRQHYRPERTIVVVVGDVDPTATLALVERYYGAMPPGETIVPSGPEEPPRRGFRFRELAGDIARSYLEWGWRTPGVLDPDTPLLDLLAVVLGQGRASRLYRAVRQPGLALRISAHNYTPNGLGVFNVSAELSPPATPAALRTIARAVLEAEAHGLDAVELERARTVMDARLMRRLETMEGQANLLAEWQALGDWHLVVDYRQRLLSATAADLRRVIRDYLAPELGTILLYRPRPAPALGVDSTTLFRRLYNAEDAAGDPPELPASTAVPAVTTPLLGTAAQTAGAGHAPALPREAPRPYRPGVSPRAVGIEEGVHLFAVAGAARIAVLPRSSPLVTVGIVVPGGILEETEATAGTTSLLVRSSLKGTVAYDAGALALAAEGLGGSIAPTITPDLFEWRISVPAEHLEVALGVLAEVAFRPTFPEAEVSRECDIVRADLEQLRDDMYRYPIRMCLEQAFPAHPYGLTIAATEGALATADQHRLVDWHRQRVLDAAPWVFIVGGVEPATAAGVAAPFLLGRDDRMAAASSAAWTKRPEPRAETRDRAQTAVALAFPGPTHGHADVYALQVLSAALTGLGGRLFEELRSRRSLAYQVGAFLVARRAAGLYLGYIATSPEREEEARSELLAGIAGMAQDSLTPAELEMARESILGSWRIRRQTNGACLTDLTHALLLGRGLQEISEFEARIRAVTADAIRVAAARYLDVDRAVTAVVRGTGSGR